MEKGGTALPALAQGEPIGERRAVGGGLRVMAGRVRSKQALLLQPLSHAVGGDTEQEAGRQVVWDVLGLGAEHAHVGRLLRVVLLLAFGRAPPAPVEGACASVAIAPEAAREEELVAYARACAGRTQLIQASPASARAPRLGVCGGQARIVAASLQDHEAAAHAKQQAESRDEACGQSAQVFEQQGHIGKRHQRALLHHYWRRGLQLHARGVLAVCHESDLAAGRIG